MKLLEIKIGDHVYHVLDKRQKCRGVITGINDTDKTVIVFWSIGPLVGEPQLLSFNELVKACKCKHCG